jgi:membrane-bound lytic murein transglycosylase B
MFIAPVVLLCLFSNAVLAQEEFSLWLNELKQEAVTAGISDKTATATISHIELLPNVVMLDQAQPEFISTFHEYYQRRIDTQKIAQGRELLAQHAVMLSQIEAQYGVPKAILVAFWGAETNYGRDQGNIDTLSALATLSYDGRRSGFFRNQLFDAMRMIDAGNANVDQFFGSWAGAFGNMQYMPTTFMMYAVDGDGDKKIDVVNSVADSFATAANYLSQVGWRKGEPSMIEVHLPANFEWQNAQYNLRKPVAEWVRFGVTTMPDGHDTAYGKLTLVSTSSNKYKLKKHSNLHKVAYKKAKKNNLKINSMKNHPPLHTKFSSNTLLNSAFANIHGQAAIVLPQGWCGPAFMVFDNFDVVMDWNRSINYAISVVQLAKRISGEPDILGGQFAEAGALTFQQMLELQAALNARGFDAGEPDGLPGIQTQAAIRAYQLSQHIPADGYAGPNVFNSFKDAP